MEIAFDLVKAFTVGGAICVIGQLLIDFTRMTPGKVLVLFVVIGVVLGALGLYEPIVDFAGAGATVPISGFGYLLAKGAMEGAEKFSSREEFVTSLLEKAEYMKTSRPTAVNLMWAVEKQKEVIELYYSCDLSLAEIAEKTADVGGIKKKKAGS